MNFRQVVTQFVLLQSTYLLNAEQQSYFGPLQPLIVLFFDEGRRYVPLRLTSDNMAMERVTQLALPMSELSIISKSVV